MKPTWPKCAVENKSASLQHVEGSAHRLGANLSLLILQPSAPGWHWHVAFGLPADIQHKMVLRSDVFCGVNSVAIHRCVNDWVDGHLLMQLLGTVLATRAQPRCSLTSVILCCHHTGSLVKSYS